MHHNIWEETLSQESIHLKSIGLHRELRPIEDGTEPFLTYQNQRKLNLSSNNYLGIANHPSIANPRNIRTNSGSSSRLVIGHDQATEQLEKAIAAHHRTEASLLFSCGYMMNLGVLSSILRPHDAVFSDQLNHASIVDGIRLSKASQYRYRHNKMDHLETLLKKTTAQGIRRKLIVTETVFSMDGDIAPLSDIIFLKKKYGAALITDDAHGDGVFGVDGAGIPHHLGLAHHIDLQTGTFSKAYGVYGAYVAGNPIWIQHLINTCRSLIYTTALPQSIVTRIQAALNIVRKGCDLRQALSEKSTYFRTQLHTAGFHTVGETQIIPIIIGDETRALSFCAKLLEYGIMAIAIRPPTVPKGTSRIRFTMMATHPWAELEKAITCIIDVGKETGII